MVDEVVPQAFRLNADPHSARIDRAALDAAISKQGMEFRRALLDDHAHLFSDVALFVTPGQVAQMREVIDAVATAVKLPGWMNDSPLIQPAMERLGHRPEGNIARSPDDTGGDGEEKTLGVFYGYDFHLNQQGAHLIEVNSNAGGAFLNALLIESQRHVDLPGANVAEEKLEAAFLAMFRNEWKLARDKTPLAAVAIVDERPAAQYLYPEFLLAREILERAGIKAYIVDPSDLQARDPGLFVDDQKIDLIYNRLTDFSLQRYPQLRSAGQNNQVVLTPHPRHYQRYADKRKLVLLSDGDWLRAAGVSEAEIGVLLRSVPQTKPVNAADADLWWTERKQWFFKPVSGYGSKGAYRGEKLTKRVFADILQSDYVAQKLAAPGERNTCVHDGETLPLKYDVRCYVYDGHIQLIAARLYQGQTTNFRTLGGGFALVRVVG